MAGKAKDHLKKLTRNMLKSLELRNRAPGPTAYDTVRSSFHSSSTQSIGFPKGKTYRMKYDVDPA